MHLLLNSICEKQTRRGRYDTLLKKKKKKKNLNSFSQSTRLITCANHDDAVDCKPLQPVTICSCLLSLLFVEQHMLHSVRHL